MVNTGDRTVMGRIAKLTSTIKQESIHTFICSVSLPVALSSYSLSFLSLPVFHFLPPVSPDVFSLLMQSCSQFVL